MIQDYDTGQKKSISGDQTISGQEIRISEDQKEIAKFEKRNAETDIRLLNVESLLPLKRDAYFHDQIRHLGESGIDAGGCASFARRLN